MMRGMGSLSQATASSRTVVLLRPHEREHLERLAAEEHVSSGEILRRSLDAYEQKSSASEQEMLHTLLAEMNSALEGALVSIRSARSEIRESLNRVREMREGRA